MTEKRFEWTPLSEIDPEAIARMRGHFLKPAEPMGEAWFMSKDRRMFTELQVPDAPRKIDPVELSGILGEIGGTFAFGRRREWDDWFRYLLPDLILRAKEEVYPDDMLIGQVVTAFMGVFWKGIREEYPGFRQDVIDTLALVLVDKDLWQIEEDNPVPRFLIPKPVHYKDFKLDWHDGKADPSVSALIFFCLKYLGPGEIITWSASLFSVSDIYWKGNLLVWLYGAWDLLNSPVVLPTLIEKAMPRIKWEGSHVLTHGPDSKDATGPVYEDTNYKDEFLPPENVAAFLGVIGEILTPDLLLEWMEDFSKEKLLHPDYFRTPELLYRKLF